MNPRKLLGQGTIYLAMLVLQRGIQVFLLPFATRQLPKSDLGILGVAVTLSAGIAIIATGGLSYAVLRLTGEERPEAGSVS
ncbi:MAG: hypothetical protein OEX97_10380, partial [Acidimicrobiia bacterium]|nr:hypothetical protein [Acidimicrobiia bacterium]